MASMMQRSSRCTKCWKTCSQVGAWPQSAAGSCLNFLLHHFENPKGLCFVKQMGFVTGDVKQQCPHFSSPTATHHQSSPTTTTTTTAGSPNQQGFAAGGKGALADSFGGLDEHRQLAEKLLGCSPGPLDVLRVVSMAVAVDDRSVSICINLVGFT